MLLPRSFNSRVQVITSNAGTVGRISYNPKAPAKINEMQAEMECDKEVAALRTIAFSLNQFAESNFTGEVLIISYSGKSKEGRLTGPIVRCWEMVKQVKAGADPRTTMLKDWMYEDEEHEDLVVAIEELIAAYEACEAKVSFAPIKSATVWEINAQGQEIPIGAELVFDAITGEATTFITKDEEGNEVTTDLTVPVTAEIKLRGKYKVTTYAGDLHVERPNNSKEMIDVLTAIERAKALIPELSVETAQVVAGEDF